MWGREGGSSNQKQQRSETDLTIEIKQSKTNQQQQEKKALGAMKGMKGTYENKQKHHAMWDRVLSRVSCASATTDFFGGGIGNENS